VACLGVAAGRSGNWIGNGRHLAPSGSWAFTLAPSENDHIGPQVAHKARKQIRARAARGCALEWNYVETAVQQTGTGRSVAAGRIGSPGFLGYDATTDF
jgi:hypothetical protein